MTADRPSVLFVGPTLDSALFGGQPHLFQEGRKILVIPTGAVFERRPRTRRRRAFRVKRWFESSDMTPRRVGARSVRTPLSLDRRLRRFDRITAYPTAEGCFILHTSISNHVGR